MWASKQQKVSEHHREPENHHGRRREFDLKLDPHGPTLFLQKHQSKNAKSRGGYCRSRYFPGVPVWLPQLCVQCSQSLRGGPDSLGLQVGYGSGNYMEVLIFLQLKHQAVSEKVFYPGTLSVYQAKWCFKPSKFEVPLNVHSTPHQAMPLCPSSRSSEGSPWRTQIDDLALAQHPYLHHEYKSYSYKMYMCIYTYNTQISKCTSNNTNKHMHIESIKYDIIYSLFYVYYNNIIYILIYIYIYIHYFICTLIINICIRMYWTNNWSSPWNSCRWEATPLTSQVEILKSDLKKYICLMGSVRMLLISRECD